MAFRGGSSISGEVKRLADALIKATAESEERYRKVCLEAGNANTRIYQILRDAGPSHFYELVAKSSLSRSTVYAALVALERLGLVEKDERTDLWSVV